MSGKQQAVLWIGFILIAFHFFVGGQWTALWKTITGAYAADVVGSVAGGVGKDFRKAMGGSSTGSGSVQQAASVIPAPGVTKV